MKLYQKFIAALVVIFSGLAFVPYVEAGFSGGTAWRQFANAYRPRISAENIAFISALNLQSEGVAIDGNYLYSTFNNLAVIDHSDPTRLKVVNKFKTDFIYDLELSGQYAFAAQQDYGVRCFDLTVGLPTVLSGRSMGGSALGLGLADGVLYVAGGKSGLTLIDASKPADLPVISRADTAGTAQDVAAGGGYAFVAGGEAGLLVFDVSDAANPREIAALNTPGWANDVTLDGDTLYLADGEAGLIILDVSDPAHPKEISKFNTSGTVVKTLIQGNFAYLADRQSGLVVLDVSDKSKPEKLGGYDTLGGAWDVVVKDGYIYLADFPYGVQVLKFIPPATGRVPTTGGGFTTTPDGIRYDFPPGGFSFDALVKHQPLSANGVPPSSLLFPKVGPFFSVTAKDSIGNTLKVKQTYTIAVPYSDEGLTLKQEKALGFYTWDGRQWLLEPTSLVDTEANTITAALDRLVLGGVLMDKAKSYTVK